MKYRPTGVPQDSGVVAKKTYVYSHRFRLKINVVKK